MTASTTGVTHYFRLATYICKLISPRCRVQFFVHFKCTRLYCDDILRASDVRQWLPTLAAATRESILHALPFSTPKLCCGWSWLT